MKFKEMKKLPRSCRLVLAELFEIGKPITVRDLKEKVPMVHRTISFALRKLVKSGLIKKMHNLKDMRMPLYYIPKERKLWFRQIVGKNLREFLWIKKSQTEILL